MNWWRRLVGTASGITIGFGVLVLACALVAVAGPRASEQLRTSAFRQILAREPALDTTIVGRVDAGSLGFALHSQVGATQLTRTQAGLRHNLAGKVPLAAARSDWVGLTTPFAGFADHSPVVAPGVGTQFELLYRSDLGRHVRVLAGSLPAAVARRGGITVVPVAVSEVTARRYGLTLGSRLALPSVSLALRVTGIVAPVGPANPFWQFDPIAAAPVLVTPGSTPSYWQGAAFVPASALPALGSGYSPPEIQLTWVFGLALSRLTAVKAIGLARSLPLTLGTAGVLGGVSQTDLQLGGLDNVTLTSGAASLLASFATEDGAVGNVLDLMSVSLAAVGAVVVLLAAWLMAERRRAEFAVLRARGAARRQLAVTAVSGSAIVAVPAAAAGVAVAVGLTAGEGASLAWWLAGLTVMVALAGPTAITVRMHRGYAGLARPDRPVRRIAAIRRIVAETLLVVGSAGGLIVLRHQGAGQGGGDLYASAAPILVAIPVAIVLLRLYPLIVRPLLLAAGRRPGVTAFLGLARAARVPATSVLPAFAMVLALSLVSFAGMVRGAVLRGEVTQSWQQTGADAVITAPIALTPAQQRDIAAVPGVRRTAAFGLTSAARGSGLTPTIMVTDPEQYAPLLASTPLAPVPARFVHWPGPAAGHGGAVPVLASAALAARLGRGPVNLGLQYGPQIRIDVVGIAPAMSAVGALSAGGTSGYLVLPWSAIRAGAPPVSGELVAGPQLDGAALTALARGQLRGAQVIERSGLLAALEHAPLERDAYAELAQGGAVAAAGCLLVLLLTLLLSAHSRQVTLARTATMGMSGVQARWLAIIEALPQIVSVIIGGLICALALAPLVGPALDLSVFTGSTAAVPVRVEPAWLTAAAIGLLVLAIGMLAGQAVVAGRGVARSLRMGE